MAAQPPLPDGEERVYDSLAGDQRAVYGQPLGEGARRAHGPELAEREGLLALAAEVDVGERLGDGVLAVGDHAADFAREPGGHHGAVLYHAGLGGGGEDLAALDLVAVLAEHFHGPLLLLVEGADIDALGDEVAGQLLYAGERAADAVEDAADEAGAERMLIGSMVG